MNYKFNLIKERFDMQITTENQVFKQTFEMDKNARLLVGMAITSNRDDMLFYRGSQKIQLNDWELFPEGFESKLLMSGLNVSPNERMIILDDIETGNRKIEITYTDKTHELVKFVPYRVTIYTFCKVQ